MPKFPPPPVDTDKVSVQPKTMLDSLTESLSAGGLIPKFVVRLLVLRVIWHLVQTNLMTKSGASQLKNGLSQFARTGGPVVAGGTLQVKTTEVLDRLVQITFPDDRMPSKRDYTALLTVAERHGIHKSDVDRFLTDLLDSKTLHLIGVERSYHEAH